MTAPTITLETLVQNLRQALGPTLESVILYGSAAANDTQALRSNLDVLCVLRSLGPHELLASGPILRQWREAGHPAPLLLTAHEIQTSTDCFPMEFQDMAEQRRILWGNDPIAGLEIDRTFYRAHLEHQLRTKQIRLRQKAADLLDQPEKLTVLMADSLSTFCVLARHALVLAGHSPRFKKAEILAELEGVLARPLPGSNAILTIRSGNAVPSETNAGQVFAHYLNEMEALVEFVDRLR